MTPHEWVQIRDRIYAIHGKTSKWVEAAALLPDVQTIPYDVAARVVEGSMGERTPSPGDIIAAARTHLIGDHRTVTTPGPEDCDHPAYAIIEYLDDGRRRGMCRVCRVEQVFPTGRLLMKWELEEQRLATQQGVPV